MELSQASLLLDPPPQLETGFERLPNGVLHVACRTDLHNCTGEMFEWWFRSRPGTREYIWWHPWTTCPATGPKAAPIRTWARSIW